MNINYLNSMEKMQHNFVHEVIFKYQLFNGLFLSLPFEDIDEAGAVLSIFAKACEEGLQEGKTPQEIVEQFWQEINFPEARREPLLFKFLQFIERQIVLFDALEDAAFSKTHDLSGDGTIDNLLHQISQDQHKFNILKQTLDSYKVRIVLTAHPTQFYPNQILTIIADMGQALKNNDLDEIRNLFLQLGLTRFSNQKKPTPFDEAASLIWYLENIFYTEFSKIQEKLPSSNINLELGFWPGGDRDGNPFVVADTTLKVASRLRATILRLYHKDLRLLRRKLTFDTVYEKINEIIIKVNGDQYLTASILIAELEEVIVLLKKNYQSLSVNLVENLIVKIRLFNFYFVKIDIRQNSAIHKQVIGDMFQEHGIHKDYANLTDTKKIELLKANLSRVDLLQHDYTDAMVNEVINTIKAVHSVQQSNGVNAIERYIISNTNSVASIFEVYFLITLTNNYLQKAKTKPKTEPICLEIVPLFETIDDLMLAPIIMETLYNDSNYKKLLKQHNNRQTIMLGFSDGTKDGGYLMANWSIYVAKKNLTILANKYEIQVVFFDGRGGPPSRGGGNTRDFYHAMGADVATKEIQLTIQGQTISSNFGAHDTAAFNLEQLFTSGLVAKIFPQQEKSITKTDEKLISLLAQECYTAYLDLRHDDMFIPYLEEITPLKYLTSTNIGSRPAKRNSDGRLHFEDLRAIPFVGAWTQMKQNILGYYGLGTGIKILIKKDKAYADKLYHLYRNSLFFKTLINNSMESLAKSNFAITKHLEHDPKFGRFWSKLYNETILTQKMLLKITGHPELLEKDAINQQSIDLRERIVLPLLVIQQYALAMLRENKSDDNEMLEKLVKKSLAANINASRNSV